MLGECVSVVSVMGDPWDEKKRRNHRWRMEEHVEGGAEVGGCWVAVEGVLRWC